MFAYKFLDRNGAAVISGIRWPLPDGEHSAPWIEGEPVIGHDGAVLPCRFGLHACRAQDLAYWIHQELWEVEFDGETVEARHKLVGARARLARRIGEWADSVGHELGRFCLDRSRQCAIRLLRVHGEDAWADRLAEAEQLEVLGAAATQIVETFGDGTVLGTAAGMVETSVRLSPTMHYAGAPFFAAWAAGHEASFASGRQSDYDVAYAAERVVQSQWIAHRLALN